MKEALQYTKFLLDERNKKLRVGSTLVVVDFDIGNIIYAESWLEPDERAVIKLVTEFKNTEIREILSPLINNPQDYIPNNFEHRLVDYRDPEFFAALKQRLDGMQFVIDNRYYKIICRSEP
jgi:hypothetical protein